MKESQTRHTAVPPVSDPWVLAYDGFDAKQEPLREALCALGNGLFVTRGAAEESDAGAAHYPGTYFAGGYNQLASEVSGHVVVNEDLVNFPNWLALTFASADGEWLGAANYEILEYRQELHVREGVLVRRFRARDAQGRITAIASRRIVSMSSRHYAGIEWSITAENWSGTLRIRSELDGAVVNSGVARYRELSNRHLEVLGSAPVAPEGVQLLVQTNQSRVQVAMAARTRVYGAGHVIDVERHVIERTPGRIGEELVFDVTEGDTRRIEKIVTVFSSRHRGIGEAGVEARLALASAPEFAELYERHSLAWASWWRRYDVELAREDGSSELAREQLTVRLHIFHLLQTVSSHTVGLDVGAPARGLHGEAYRGHVFWDELFIFPFYDFRTPDITRSLLLYRYYRLDAARALAREAGFAGAMFPWQSSSDGREATQQLHLNPLSGRWDPDWSHLQRHVNAAIVYNLWRYYRSSGDRGFLIDYGAELVLEIARFWSSSATWSDARERWEILGVMGPDEYHEKYPNATEGGLRNNAYTNVMAVWCLLRALDVLQEVGEDRAAELLAQLRIDEAELTRWNHITNRMFVPFHDGGIISQFEGYDTLEEFDWAGYRKKYGNIERLDRILKAEGDTPDRYRLSKQADLNMLFFLFDRDQLRALFQRLGYEFDDDLVRRNILYYMERTSHGSTLSKMVFASVIHELQSAEGYRLFMEALRSDVDDIQGGTTAEGIHLGAMAGTVAIMLHRYAGVQLSPQGVALSPVMPEQLHSLRFRVCWRGRWLHVDLTRTRVRVTADRDHADTLNVAVNGVWQELRGGSTLEIDIA